MEKHINGYAGYQLRLRLDNKESKIEPLQSSVLEKYIGGVGYSARILYDELEKGVDPLSPENKLVFATSPMTLNSVPGGGSVMVCFKSPLTNGWGEARCGGDFGPDMKKAGYDFIIVEGKSDEPVYIVVDEDKVEFKPADHLRGKSTSEKSRIIQEEAENKKISVMSIGPGGENLVRYACIMFEGRTAGRGGAGAVMGSKNLLGIAVKGSKKVKEDNPEELKKALKEVRDILKSSEGVAWMRENGTPGMIPGNDDIGDWPTKNFQSNMWGKGETLYEQFQKNNLLKNNACYTGCPVGCGRIAEVKDGKYKTPVHEGAEYESLSAFTAFVLNDNMDAAIHATYLCNEYGIDTISAGSSIAFLMECYENGIVKKQDVEEIDLSWGNPDALCALVRMIAYREGIGDMLAEGVKIAGERLGNGAEKLAMHGKGLEAPAHDPRSGKALAVAYGSCNRGICHIHPLEGQFYDAGKFDFGMAKYGVADPNTMDRWDEEGKGKAVKILQDGMILPDVLSICKFFVYEGITIVHFTKILTALTGWDIDDNDLVKIGERVWNLQRMFNLREGLDRKDDGLPERMKSKPAFGKFQDEQKCTIKNFDGMMDEYYTERKWDIETGNPSHEVVQELGL